MEREAGSRIDGLRGWFLERSGFGILNAFGLRQLGKPVPTRLSWLYTTGALAIFYFGLQVVTGCLLLTVYVPHEELAYKSVQIIEHQASLGWLVRQCHSWGASFVVIVLIMHMIKVLWYGTYKRPREFTWFVGCLLFAITLGFCFSGYLLPWNQLAFWATRVGIAAVDSVPWIGPELKSFICGSDEVSGATIGRFFALHVVVLPGILLLMLAWHLALITWKGISPKIAVGEELDLGNVVALRKTGSEPFFPRQVYRDLVACSLGFAALVTVATYCPWPLGEPADEFSTPEGIKPEWYFLPVYQFLKYFDDNLYSALPFLKSWGVEPDFLGVTMVNIVASVLFLLPVLDRGKERKITRRPLFALLAFVFLIGVLAMGVLGYLAERTIEIGGTKYHFDTKGVLTGSLAREGQEEDREDESAFDSKSAVKEDGGVSTAPAAVVVTWRADMLPPGGTCVGCHVDQAEEWEGSVHHDEEIECARCHGGIDTTSPEKLLGIVEGALESEDTEWPDDLDGALEAKRAYLWAHQGVQLNRGGDPSSPRSKDVPVFCGKCHETELRHWQAAEPEQTKSCKSCHGNHQVQRVGPFLYEEDGYTDEDDPRTRSFQAIGKILLEVDGRFQEAESTLGALRAKGYPLDGAVEEQKRFESLVTEKNSELSPLVHTLNEERVRSEAAELVAALDALHGDLRSHLDSHDDDRPIFVLGVWVLAVFFTVVLTLKLRSLGPAVSTSEGAPSGSEDSAADVAGMDTERGALLHPLDPESGSG